MDTKVPVPPRMDVLEAMGFRREDATPIPTEITPLRGSRHRLLATRASMGTLVSITAIHDSRTLLGEAAGRAFEEMEAVVDILNRYDPASALSVLNDAGRIRKPPPELRAVLAEALSHSLSSGGAFDPTVQPLVDLFRSLRTTEKQEGAMVLAGTREAISLLLEAPGGSGNHRRTEPSPAPSPAEVRELLELVDPGAVKLTPDAVHLEKAGMGVTLDGIAKGYVVDRIAEVLRSSGLTDFLVDGGGDIRCSGVREDGLPWRVAVQDPEKAGAFPDVIPLSNGAVATSGSYEIYFDPQRTHHHIVSALDGASPQLIQSVSVVAPTAMRADALATSVFLMGPARGAAYIDSLPGCACLIIDTHGEETRSARWRSAGDFIPLEAETP